MADRRKIVIPLASEPETPHFDAEETLLSARPVVPIEHASRVEDFSGYGTTGPAPFYKRSLFLALVVIVAVGVGLAAGLSIARYRPEVDSKAAAPPAQAAPAANDTRTAAAQTTKDSQAAPVLPEVKVEEKSIADADEKADEAEKEAKPSTSQPETAEKRKSDKDDSAGATPNTSSPSTRDKKRTDDDGEETDTPAPRAQRRERRTRNRDEDTVDIPRRIERASEQINRIREIFEGTQRP